MSFPVLRNPLYHNNYFPAYLLGSQLKPFTACQVDDGSNATGVESAAVDPMKLRWAGPVVARGWTLPEGSNSADLRAWIPVTNVFPLWARVKAGETVATGDYVCVGTDGMLARKIGSAGRAGFRVLALSGTEATYGVVYAFIDRVTSPIIASHTNTTALAVASGGTVAYGPTIDKSGTWLFHVSATVSASTSVARGTALQIGISKNGSVQSARGSRDHDIERDNYNTVQFTTAENVAFSLALSLAYGDTIEIVNPGTATTDYTNVLVATVWTP